MLSIVLLTVVLTSAQATTATTHCARFKSFAIADRECSRYLGRQRSCAVRCRGLVTRFWNRTSMVPEFAVMESYYEPDETDYLYRSRTTQCLRDVRTGSVCELARRSVLCYDREFGALDREGLRFVPFTDVQHRRVLRECAEMLKKNTALEDSCMLRCFLMREGLYNDRDGPKVERIAVQWSELGRDIRLWSSGPCVTRLLAKQIDGCTLAAQVVKECLNAELEFISRGVILRLMSPALSQE